MWKKKKYVVAGLLMGSLYLLTPIAKAQTDQFLDIYLEPSVVRGTEIFDLEFFQLLKKKKKANEIKVVNKSNQETIFSFYNTRSNSHFTNPKFFKSSIESQPVILLVDVHSSHSLGQEVFLIKENEVIHSGFIEFAVDDYNFSSLSLYSHFEMKEDNIVITFEDIDLIDLVNEEIVKGSSLRYEIQEGIIKRVMN